MRTTLVLGLLAITSVAVADPAPAPTDPYPTDPAPGAPQGSEAPGRPVDPAGTPAPSPQARTAVTVRVGHGPLGIAALEISEDLRMHLGAPRDRGVLVDAVFSNTLAAKAGLKVGDLVLEIDGSAVASANDVIAAIGKRKKGDQVTLDILRTGIPTTLRATLDRDPPAWPRFEHRFRSFGPSATTGDLEDVFGGAPFGGIDFDRQLRRQIEEMRRRLEDMERRFDREAPARPLAPRGGDRT